MSNMAQPQAGGSVPMQAVVSQSNSVPVPAQNYSASKDDEEEPSKFRLSNKNYKTFTYAMIAVGIVLGLIGMGTAISAYTDLKNLKGDFDAALDSWRIQPYTQMTFTNGACPADAQEIFQKAIWPGTQFACDCQCASLVSTGGVNVSAPARTYNSDASCTTLELNDGCYNVDAIAPIEADFFPVANWKLCAGRTAGASALERPPIGNGMCLDGSVLCGEALDFQFCFPGTNTSDCPITDFIVGPADPNLELIAYETIPGYTFNFVDYNLYIKRGGTFSAVSPFADRSTDPYIAANLIDAVGYPVITISMQPALPCYTKGNDMWGGYPGRSGEYSAMESAYESGHCDTPTGTDNTECGAYTSCDKGYVLHKFSKQTGCPAFIDGRVKIVMHQPEIDVFGVLPVEFRTLNTEYDIFLSYVTETQWQNDDELEETGCPSRDKAIANQGDVDNLWSAQTALIVLTVIVVVALGVIGAVAKLVWTSEDEDGRITKGEPHYDHLQYMKYAKYVLKVAMYTCTIITMIYAANVLVMFSEAVNGDNCSDSITGATFNNLYTTIDSLSSKNLVTALANAGDFITDMATRVLTGEFL